MSRPRKRRRGRRLGLRREILILLPAALLLLAILSTFTLFSYRNGVELLAEERRLAAATLARDVAAAVAAETPNPYELRRLAPRALAVALIDAAGEPLVTAGELPASDLLRPAGPRPPDEPAGFGPGEELPDRVAGFAPLGPPAARRWVRVDLPAELLAGQRRGLAVLTFVVLTVDAALVLLVVLFLRHLLALYEILLERARQMGELGGHHEDGEDDEDGEDEVEFLLATFERALASLAAADPRHHAAEAEEDIAALERMLAPSLQSGLLLLDRQGDVLALNPMGAELLGVPAPTPGAPLAEVLAGQPELAAILTAAVADEQEVQRRELSVRVGQATLTLGATVHPLRRDDGGVRGWLVLFADLTEAQRRAGESRLAESLARLAEMAGGMAHELRNGLATLRGYLTLIERRPDEGSIVDFVREIRGEADHLERVLDDFLAFARPGTARLAELSLPALVRRAAADPALAGTELRLAGLDRSGGEADVRLKGDAQLLERAVRNLLRNAAEAEREAGRAGPIDVVLARRPEGVELAIEDRGAGVPRELRERLFHPFATGRAGGVGLGLTLVHRVVTLHGGHVRLDDRPGGGTRAVIWLPSDTIVTEGSAIP